jgi:hypothetical protein
VEVGVLEGEGPESENRGGKPSGRPHFPRLGGDLLVASDGGVPGLRWGRGWRNHKKNGSDRIFMSVTQERTAGLVAIPAVLISMGFLSRGRTWRERLCMKWWNCE